MASPAATAQSAPSPASARTKATPKKAKRRLSRKKWENAYVASKMKKHNLVLDPNPEGKVIEKIIVEVDEVFDPLDQSQLNNIPILGKAIQISNYLHATSHPYVAEREVLFKVGEPFRLKLAQETERNLRAIIIFAIGRVVACKGSRPDRVKVLVATKDRWSLRMNTDFQVAGGQLDFLRIALTETNLAGRRKQLEGIIQITRDTVSIGQAFTEPRILSSRVAFAEEATVIFGKGGRGLEGGTANLAVGQPLYSLASKWGYNVSAQAQVMVNRLFRGSDFFRCFSPRFSTDITCDSDLRTAAERAALIGTHDIVMPLYRSRVVTVTAQGQRRFGAKVKHDLSWGYVARHRNFELLGDFPNDPIRDLIAARFVPRSENASLLFVSYRSFAARFTTMRHLNRFATTEDFQLGHDMSMTASWASPILGFDNAFLELNGVAQYRWLLGPKNLFTIAAQLQSRLDFTRAVNSRAQFVINNVSPILWIGRLIFEARAIFRFRDQDNVRSTLGGNMGLRGFDNNVFRGRHMVNLHLEYRTIPMDLLTSQVGFVAFYDAGHAADELSQLKLRHSVGVGLRIFFPQINTMVLRVDLGFPFSEGPADFGQQFSISFDQAF